MPGQQYKAAALARAQELGLAHTQVRDMGYAAIAGLAGVMLGLPGNTSPADFFYRNIRAAVANELKAAAVTAAQHSARDSMVAAIRAQWGEATLEIDPEGRYVIDLHGGELPGLGVNP